MGTFQHPFQLSTNITTVLKLQWQWGCYGKIQIVSKISISGNNLTRTMLFRPYISFDTVPYKFDYSIKWEGFER